MSHFYNKQMNIRQTTFKIDEKENIVQTILTHVDDKYLARLLLGDKIIGRCSIVNMPGNCGMVVSTELSIDEPFRRKGLTQIFRNQMYDIVKNDMHIRYIIATVLEDNVAEIGSSGKSGFNIIDNFVNNKTKHKIVIIGKKL